MALEGLRVLTLESRRPQDMATLILREGGTPVVAPSVKERALDDDSTAVRFVEDLEAGRYDLVVYMTGVGLTFLRDTLVKTMPESRIADALRRAAVVARGPKPVGLLRSLGVPVAVIIQEPNTWREVVQAIAERPERRIAVQEYGRSNHELYDALAALGAEVTPIPIYRWELPDDIAPLENAVRELSARSIDVVLFTSSIQFDHLMTVAARLGQEDAVRSALASHAAVGSIGEVMTDALNAHGFPPDFMPRHPKMWALVKTASEEAVAAIKKKRL